MPWLAYKVAQAYLSRILLVKILIVLNLHDSLECPCITAKLIDSTSYLCNEYQNVFDRPFNQSVIKNSYLRE